MEKQLGLSFASQKNICRSTKAKSSSKPESCTGELVSQKMDALEARKVLKHLNRKLYT